MKEKEKRVSIDISVYLCFVYVTRKVAASRCTAEWEQRKAHPCKFINQNFTAVFCHLPITLRERCEPISLNHSSRLRF